MLCTSISVPYALHLYLCSLCTHTLPHPAAYICLLLLDIMFIILLLLCFALLLPVSLGRSGSGAALTPIKILWIHPVGSAPRHASAPRAPARADPHSFRSFLNSIKHPNTQVDVVSLSRGPPHLEYQSYEALVAADTLNVIRRAELQHYDAAVIGCFYDPFLDAAREVSKAMSVTAPAEAALHIATTLGRSFSILVGRKKWIPKMRENVLKYGFGGHLASFKALGLWVEELQADPEETQRRMVAAAREAVDEDGAEVIILGCTIEYGFYAKLQQLLGVPVVDVVAATLSYTEMLVNLKRRYGWTHSKQRTYEGPPQEQLDFLLKQYQNRSMVKPKPA